MGFASTRAEARQLVAHKSILVNGSIVNIPSYQVSASAEIAVREKSKKQNRIQLAMELSEQSGQVEWVDVDNKALKGVFKNVPARGDLSSDIEEHLIVELYSK
jgi:small subunit ribosomal protein S4